jgi:hypothetical protein
MTEGDILIRWMTLFHARPSVAAARACRLAEKTTAYSIEEQECLFQLLCTYLLVFKDLPYRTERSSLKYPKEVLGTGTDGLPVLYIHGGHYSLDSSREHPANARDRRLTPRRSKSGLLAYWSIQKTFYLFSRPQVQYGT